MNSYNQFLYTKILLEMCKEVKYTIITIGKGDIKNPTCSYYPKDWWRFEDNIFAWGLNIDKIRLNGSPAIWSILKKLEELYKPCLFYGGCGNGHQHELVSNQTPLIHGTYFIENDPLSDLFVKIL